MSMIYICPLELLQKTLATAGARHLVTICRPGSLPGTPPGIERGRHLVLEFHDATAPVRDPIAPSEEHVAQLVGFVGRWDRTSPLLIHCHAGRVRSTAACFIGLCSLNPERDERAIAEALRRASPTASPDRRFIDVADRVLRRDGRMIAAIEAIGPGADSDRAMPFRLAVS